MVVSFRFAPNIDEASLEKGIDLLDAAVLVGDAHERATLTEPVEPPEQVRIVETK